MHEQRLRHVDEAESGNHTLIEQRLADGTLLRLSADLSDSSRPVHVVDDEVRTE